MGRTDMSTGRRLFVPCRGSDTGSMRLAIFGSGGLGGYFGARLAHAGRDVVFIARGRNLSAMRANGLAVSSALGDFHLGAVEVTDDPASVGPVDVVLVGVKTWQVEEAAAAMRPLIGSETVVIPLQNGVEAPAQLASVLGAGPVLGGFCRAISFLDAPGRIRHVGVDPYLGFGELDNRRSARVERVLETLSGIDHFTAEVPADIHVGMWNKFTIISAISGVGAVTRMPIGLMRSVPQSRLMFEQALAEIVQVAHARDIALPTDTVPKLLEFTDTFPPEGTSSMQRDIMEGRPSELEAQNGAVVRLGREVGVPVPINEFIYHSLLPMELVARGAIHLPQA